LLDNGNKIIYVLYISANAIERASKVQWIVSDITEFEPPVEFDIWCDSAHFIFLEQEIRFINTFSLLKMQQKKMIT